MSTLKRLGFAHYFLNANPTRELKGSGTHDKKVMELMLGYRTLKGVHLSKGSFLVWDEKAFLFLIL